MTLRLRLALWYGGLTAALAVLLAGFTYAIHLRDQYDGIDAALAGAVHHAVSEDADSASLAVLAEIMATPPVPGMEVHVFDAGGALLAASTQASRAPVVDPVRVAAGPDRAPYGPLLALAPRLTSVQRGPGAFVVATGPDGDRWRVEVVRLGGSERYLAVAVPLAPTDRGAARLGWLLAALGGLGTVATFGAAWLVAGRALRPLRAMTASATAIAGSHDLERRVPVGIGRDELSALARTFNEMLTSLEAAQGQQKRFIADASHELRAPLTAIQANLELLEQFPAMPRAQRRIAVAEARREAERMARLVGDLLALARAEAGVAMRSGHVELDRVVLEAVREARLLADGCRVEVGRLTPAVVRGDADRLRQVLLVLLDNAVRYTQPGRRVQVELRERGQSVDLSVRDAGPGIPETDLAHVFERFYRAAPARAADPAGTGLGLPIARSIVERHGGRIALHSRPGVGTLARVTLPREEHGRA